MESVVKLLEYLLWALRTSTPLCNIYLLHIWVKNAANFNEIRRRVLKHALEGNIGYTYKPFSSQSK